MTSPKYLKEGTILVPKPEWVSRYKKWTKYIVTKEDERQHGILGCNWMVKTPIIEN